MKVWKLLRGDIDGRLKHQFVTSIFRHPCDIRLWAALVVAPHSEQVTNITKYLTGVADMYNDMGEEEVHRPHNDRLDGVRSLLKRL